MARKFFGGMIGKALPTVTPSSAPSLDLAFDGTTSSFTRATTAADAAKANGDQLATSIVTQNKTGTVQSKYMGPHGKLISSYVENKAPHRNPDTLTLAGASVSKTTGQPAPDGSNDAVLFTADVAGNFYGVDSPTNASFTSGEYYTLSVYIKVVTGTLTVGPLLNLSAFGGVYERAQYTISAGGGVPLQPYGGYRSGSGDYGIQDVGDGWYRIWVSGTATTTITNGGNQVFRVDNASIGDKVLVWGLQLEEGVLVPSEFVDATADQVARVEYGNLRTNLVSNTEMRAAVGSPYDEYAMITSGPTVTVNAATDPAGGVTASKITPSGAGSYFAGDSQDYAAGTTYTFSSYFKVPSGSTFDGRVGFLLYGSEFNTDGDSSNLTVYWNLETDGTASFNSTSTTPPEDYGIIDVGNGWYRIWVTETCTTSGTAKVQQYPRVQGINGTGDTLLQWGAQVEEGAGPPTELIHTHNGAASVGEPLGLLVEEERTNIRPYSTATSLAVPQASWTGSGGEWSAFNSNDTLSFSTAPDGTNTAVRMQLPINTNQLVRLHAGANYTLAAGETQTVSFWIKDRLTTSGHILVESYADTVTGRKYTYTSDRPQNQWVRITHTFTNSTGSDITKLAIDVHGDNLTAYDFDLWGFQIEVGEAATSYIPTTSVTPTRLADDITLATSNFGYNVTAGTTAADFTMREATDNYPRVYEVSSDTDNRDSIFYAAPSTALRAEIKESASSTAWSLTSSVTFPFSAKAIVRHDGSNGVAAVDGTLGASQSITTAPSTTRTQVALGLNADLSGNNMNGHIRRFTYWPRALSDEQLAEYTNSDIKYYGEDVTSTGIKNPGVLSLNEYYLFSK